ncbi:hypothetical protein M0R45_016232 [Rubus argutus]|uniref:Apple domain-containing protein n=1 Tax=Rubus argutus TaxID=59490 RepID=A0AAW1XUC6_RUBAR
MAFVAPIQSVLSVIQWFNCLNGFKPEVPEKWNDGEYSGGCYRIEALNCQNKDDGFVKCAGVKLPDTIDSRLNQSMSPKECKDNYSNVNGERVCIIWFGDLVNIRRLSDGGQDLCDFSKPLAQGKDSSDRCFGCFWDALGCLLHSEEEDRVQRKQFHYRSLNIVTNQTKFWHSDNMSTSSHYLNLQLR